MTAEKVLGLCGFYGAGKDMLAKKVTELAPSFYHAKFADPLIRIAKESHPEWSQHTSWETAKKTEREFVNTLGESIRKNISPFVFANKLIQDTKTYKNIVISDVRLPEEHKLLTKTFKDKYYLVLVDSPLQTSPDNDDSYLNTAHLSFIDDVSYFVSHRVSDDPSSLMNSLFLDEAARSLLRNYPTDSMLEELNSYWRRWRRWAD